MANIGQQYQTADWKSEKHVPVIECPDEVAAEACKQRPPGGTYRSGLQRVNQLILPRRF